MPKPKIFFFKQSPFFVTFIFAGPPPPPHTHRSYGFVKVILMKYFKDLFFKKLRQCDLNILDVGFWQSAFWRTEQFPINKDLKKKIRKEKRKMETNNVLSENVFLAWLWRRRSNVISQIYLRGPLKTFAPNVRIAF